jgi:hypothetical protein
MNLKSISPDEIGFDDEKVNSAVISNKPQKNSKIGLRLAFFGERLADDNTNHVVFNNEEEDDDNQISSNNSGLKIKTSSHSKKNSGSEEKSKRIFYYTVLDKFSFRFTLFNLLFHPNPQIRLKYMTLIIID